MSPSLFLTLKLAILFLCSMPVLTFSALQIVGPGDSPITAIVSTSDTQLRISGIAFSPIITLNESDGSLTLEAPSEKSPTLSITLKVIGGIFNYPNPFSFSKGQTEIGYRLSKEANLTLEIYTLGGQRIYSLDISPLDFGAARYNKIPFSKTILQGSWLTPGTYLYVLIHEGKILAKNRMVILP